MSFASRQGAKAGKCFASGGCAVICFTSFGYAGKCFASFIRRGECHLLRVNDDSLTLELFCRLMINLAILEK
jgi:hypothetical protein